MNSFSTPAFRAVTFLAVVTILIFSIAVLPGIFNSNAENQTASTPTVERGFPNFDIRTQNEASARERVASFRSSNGKDASFVAALGGSRRLR